VQVVVERADGALERSIVAGALAAGHDVRVRGGADGALPRGCRRADHLGPVDAGVDAVVVVVGGLGGVPPEDWRRLDAVAREAAAAGVPVLVVARSDAAMVERLLCDLGCDRPSGWTLQACTVLHDDVLDVLERPDWPAASLTVRLQPVDAGEVAERVVRLLRLGPLGRVPDFGGPRVEALADLVAAWDGGGGLRLDEGAGDPGWPGAWLAPDRAVGRVTWAEWVEREPRAHGRSAADPVEAGPQPVGAQPGGGRPGVVQAG
jgi:hypothetical protein